jgi:orotate phosphoribosyltransferase
MNEREVYQILEKTGALLEGHFELRSKLHSNRYFQCANVLRHPREAEKLCAALAAKVRAKVPGLMAATVIAPALGGIVVGHEVARALDMLSIFAEKEEGVLVLRRFDIKPGERFVVAEDVVTRGGRTQETVDIVEKAGGIVEAIAVLVDRSGGKAKFKYPLVSLLEMEPVTWEPAACPLCASGSRAVHPGSK